MRAVLQRVRSAAVSIGGETAGQIGKGFLVLLGIAPEDTEQEGDFLLDKILGLRVFEDEAGKMNRSLTDCGGELLVVSQFTLYADCRKGRRPSPCRSMNASLREPEPRACTPNAGNSARTCSSACKTTAPSPSCWTQTKLCPANGQDEDKGGTWKC